MKRFSMMENATISTWLFHRFFPFFGVNLFNYKVYQDQFVLSLAGVGEGSGLWFSF